jgi:GAF domain-containing protein/HAMP domain-containing protein
VLRMRYDATVLQTLVAQSNRLAGPDSFAVLFDEYHIRLAHGTAPETILQAVAPLDRARLADLQAVHRLPDLPAEELSTDLPALEQNLTKAADQPYFTVEDAAISGRMNQAAVTTLKTQPWLVAFFQPQDVFLAPVEAQERRAVLLAVMIAGVVVGAALGMAQLLAGPIIRLTAVAASVSAGDLTARARVESGDEIGTLATTFNSMTEQLHGLISGLEQRVADRTRDLERRTHYLEATAEVAREAVSVLDLHELLSRVTALISQRFGFYHTGLFLLDPSGEWAVLQAASSEGGQRMLASGHRLRVGRKGIVGYVTGRGEPRIALDVGADAVFFDNPDLPDTRSEMALPLRARGEIIGALDVQSKEPEAFSGEDAAVLQTLADQVAMAISNARLLQQAEEGLEAERRTYGELSRQAWDEMLRARPDLGYRYNEEGVVPLAGHPQSPSERRGDDSERVSEPVEELPELGLPVRVRGRVIGTINAHKPGGAGEWTAEEVTLMETLTDQLGVALESARLYQDTQRRAARERLTGQVTARMRETLDMETVLKTAVQEVREALGLPEVIVRLTTQPIRQAGDDVETK